MPRIKIACCPKRKAQPCYSTYRYYLEAIGRDTWSGRRDSNPCLDLGKVPYYPYTTTALNRKTLARHRFGDKVLSKNDYRSEKEKALAPVAIAHSWRHETQNGDRSAGNQPTCSTRALFTTGDLRWRSANFVALI